MGDRLFSAVVPPGDILEQLGRWVEPRRDDEWRWTEALDWHVTLAFYADVEPWRYDGLVDRLAATAARTHPFPLSLEGVGCFGSVEKARVLYAAVADPLDVLPDLAARCHNAAATTGIDVARGRYHPHVTLARRNQQADGTRHLRALAALETSSWDATELVLVQSFLGQGPRGTPRYEVRERLPLGGA